MSGNKAFVTEAGGDLLQVMVGAPGAGNEWVFTNGWADGIDYRLRIMSIRFIYTSVAGVARQPLIRVQVGAIILATVFCGATQPAIAAYEWMLAPGAQDVILNNNVSVPWPEILIEPGYTIGTSTVNLGGADEYTNINIYFQRWRS